MGFLNTFFSNLNVCNHTLGRGYKNGLPYVSIKSIEIDGIQTKHATLEGTCSRCGQKFNVAKVHLPKNACNSLV